jgi:23S rRNA pseudouridine2605 synthase
LGDVEEGAAEEVPTAELKNALGPELIKQAGADFDAPLHVAEDSVSRHSGAGRRPEPGIQKQMRSKRLDSGSPLRGVRNDGEKSLRGHPPLQGRDKRKGKARRPDRSGGPRPSRPRPK